MVPGRANTPTPTGASSSERRRTSNGSAASETRTWSGHTDKPLKTRRGVERDGESRREGRGAERHERMTRTAGITVGARSPEGGEEPKRGAAVGQANHRADENASHRGARPRSRRRHGWRTQEEPQGESGGQHGTKNGMGARRSDELPRLRGGRSPWTERNPGRGSGTKKAREADGGASRRGGGKPQDDAAREPESSSEDRRSGRTRKRTAATGGSTGHRRGCREAGKDPGRSGRAERLRQGGGRRNSEEDERTRGDEPGLQGLGDGLWERGER